MGEKKLTPLPKAMPSAVQFAISEIHSQIDDELFKPLGVIIDYIATTTKALRFYAKNCPQNSLDGPEGYPTAIPAKRALDDV